MHRPDVLLLANVRNIYTVWQKSVTGLTYYSIDVHVHKTISTIFGANVSHGISCQICFIVSATFISLYFTCAAGSTL